MKPCLSFSSSLRSGVIMLCAACFASNGAAQGVNSARQEKMRADLQKRFAAADTNADGQLSRDEAKSGMPRVYRNFENIDTEKTGVITLEQIAAFADKQGRR